jgi:hypothetical protein
MVASFCEERLPVISVDTKKKERAGYFANSGVAWIRGPLAVNAHEFLDDALCRTTPYRVYEVLASRRTRPRLLCR